MLRFTKAQKEELDISEVCALCENASALQNENEMLCRIHGVVDAHYHCRKFRYDLLKRKPPRPLSAEKEPSFPVLPTLEDD